MIFISMYIHNLNPVLFNFGFFEIRWYSLAYIFGILIGWILGKKLIKLKNEQYATSVKLNYFDDLISYLIVSIIIGGRFGYVIFYNFEYYLKNPVSVLKIWEGGMSFHGALIGIIIGTYIFAKKRGINLFLLLDVIASVAPIGLFFGRIANFINSELYGTPSNLPWAVVFPKVDNLSRHPSQLYEATLEGLFLFIILTYINFTRKFKLGTCSSLFLIMYGIFRIVSEQFREPDVQVGYIYNYFTMGSVLSALMILFGVLIFVKIKK